MFVRFRRTPTLAEATLLQATLEAGGVRAQLVGELRPGLWGQIPSPDAMVEVQVDETQLLLAQAIVTRMDAAATGAAWVCGECREENPAQFDLCWKCGRDRLG